MSVDEMMGEALALASERCPDAGQSRHVAITCEYCQAIAEDLCKFAARAVACFDVEGALARMRELSNIASKTLEQAHALMAAVPGFFFPAIVCSDSIHHPRCVSLHSWMRNHYAMTEADRAQAAAMLENPEAQKTLARLVEEEKKTS